MQKIKLKALDSIQDIKYFEATHHIGVEIKICNLLEELFLLDGFIPTIDTNLIYHDFVIIEKIKKFLDQAITNRLLILGFSDGYYSVVNRQDLKELEKYFNTRQIFFISSSDMPQNWEHANINGYIFSTFNHFNQAIALNFYDDVFNKTEKPYKFTFLNREPRDHRKKILSELDKRNLLQQALWSDLSQGVSLPTEYPDFFNNTFYNPLIGSAAVFDFNCPLILINHQLCVDSYFSLVTETTFYCSQYHLISEKTYKPLLMGHPFIIAAGAGFYKNLHDLGYKTFDGLIDESFDSIQDHDLRLLKIVDSVEELCSRDLSDFLSKSKPICDHNRKVFFENLGRYQLSNFYNIENFLKKLTC